MSTIKIINNEDKYKKELGEGNSFPIATDYDYLDGLSSKEIRKKNTIYSYKYGIDPGDDPTILSKLYTCSCGALEDQIKVGLTCPNCHTVVKKNEFPIDRFGYIKLPFMAPTILGLQFIKDIMTANQFEEMVKGNTIVKDIYEDIDFILKSYCKPSKVKTAKFIAENKDLLFSEYVPVISAKLRPFKSTDIGKDLEGAVIRKTSKEKMERDANAAKVSKSGSRRATNIHVGSFNIEFTQLSMAVNSYNTAYENEIWIHCQLEKFHIYRILDGIYKDTIFEAFGSKKKISRDGVFAVRFPYTSVAVLAPLPEYHEMDSCTIPFQTFRAAFQEEIKDILQTVFGKSIIEANRLVNLNRLLNKKDKEIIRKCFDMIPDKYIYINRQPTIDWESIMVLKIREIRDELVLRVHTLTLSGLRADFDGDAPHMVGLNKKVRVTFHRLFSPKAHILRWNRKFNTMFGLKNDIQALAYMALDDGYVSKNTNT